MKAGATKRLVLDASVAVAWCFPDEATPYTEGVLGLNKAASSTGFGQEPKISAEEMWT